MHQKLFNSSRILPKVVLLALGVTSTLALADEPVVITVPLTLLNIKYEGNNPVPNQVNEPNVLVGCWIASATKVEKAVKKDIVKTVNGSFQQSIQLSLTPTNPAIPFQKGDLYYCSLNINSGGWANPFNTYLSSKNKPVAGTVTTLFIGGALE